MAAWIGSLDLPGLVIIPTADQLVPTPAQYELASHFPDEAVVELADRRHESIMNRAPEYVKLIIDFCDDLLRGHRLDEPAAR